MWRQFLFLLGVVTVVYSPVSGIHLDSSPTIIKIGFQRYLEVKCWLTNISESGMESLISLIISRANNQTSYKELASINVFHTDGQVKDISMENPTVSGSIDNTGESYLKIVWDFPDSDKSGVYNCEANGVNSVGHPVGMNATSRVTYAIPNSDDVLDHMKELNYHIEHIYTILNSLVNETQGYRKQRDQIKNKLFNVSESFEGRRYYLSTPHHSLIAVEAAAICQLIGGDLASPDTYGEELFIRNFLSGNTLIADVLFNKVTFGDDKCDWMSFNGLSNYKGACANVTSDSSFVLGYLCEVPE